MSLSFEFQEQLRATEESTQKEKQTMGLASEISQFQDEIREGYVPEKKATPDYGEPWKFQFIPRLETPGGNCLDCDFNVTVMYRPERSSERIVACVNACAGMADPAAEIQAMRVAIKEIYAEADACADGAPDASSHDKLCLEIATRLKPFLKP